MVYIVDHDPTFSKIHANTHEKIHVSLSGIDRCTPIVKRIVENLY